MTREAFIRKWLANKDFQYCEDVRAQMREDLYRVIDYYQQKLDIASVSGKRPTEYQFGEWVYQMSTLGRVQYFGDGDWRYCKNKVTHEELKNIFMAACASGAVDTVAEEEDREIIVNVKPTAEYKMTISKIEKITREAPSGVQP